MKKNIIILISIIILLSLLFACSENVSTENINSKDVSITKIHKKVKSHLGKDYLSKVKLNDKQVRELIGLNTNDTKEYIAEIAMINIQMDTFIAIKTKPNKVNKVKRDLIKYQKSIVEDSFQYPMNIAKVKASEVISHGDYVFFIMLGRYDERDNISEYQQLQYAKKQVSEIKTIISKFFP